MNKKGRLGIFTLVDERRERIHDGLKIGSAVVTGYITGKALREQNLQLTVLGGLLIVIQMIDCAALPTWKRGYGVRCSSKKDLDDFNDEIVDTCLGGSKK